MTGQYLPVKTTRIILAIPPLYADAQTILEVHGCVVEEKRIIFPQGTSRVQVPDVNTVMTERFLLALPDGYTLREKYDRHLELSLLVLHQRDTATAMQVAALRLQATARPGCGLVGLFRDGTEIVCRISYANSEWTGTLSPQDAPYAHPFRATSLSRLIGSALNLYHVQMLNIPVQDWKEEGAV